MNKPLSIQPIPYQGSKRSLAPRICRLFPNQIETLYEPFAGSAAVTLYAASHGLAERFIIGDRFAPLMALWGMIIEEPTELSEKYEAVWRKQFDIGISHFNDVREQFNETQDPVLFLYLVARCVKNAVRFNRQGRFTQSVDKRRTGMKPDRLTRTVHAVSKLLKGRTSVFSGDFGDCIANVTRADLVYMDPPYQGTTYGRDKRYATGLHRETLIDALHDLDRRKVSYILSYDGRSGDTAYGEPLPSSVLVNQHEIHAGRSSQATLAGRSDVTVESLYVSHRLDQSAYETGESKPIQGILFD